MAARNANMSRSKKAKNNEFYTQLSDIEKELQHYQHYFKDKTIYCNCDDYKASQFVKYFKDNYHKLKLNRLIATHHTGQPALFSKYVPPMQYIYNGFYEQVNELRGTGDFRSQECIKLLKEADIVVTNPPFSLFREYMAQLIEYGKKFLIIGNINAVNCKEIFPLIKENKVWLGIEKPKQFMQPSGQLKNFGDILWFTNLEHNKRHEELDLEENYYNPEDNPKYDNYDAIEVSKVANIPGDYAGAMGVPITFLDKFNPDQFEILGLASGRDEFGVSPTKKYRNAKQIKKDGSISNGSKVNTGAALLHATKPDRSTHYTADGVD